MPRPKKAGAPEPKRRSRNGCWPCKARKVKCDEEHPACLNCQRQGETCDYSIRLNWDGRGKKKTDGGANGQITFAFTAGGDGQPSMMSTSSSPPAISSYSTPTSRPSTGDIRPPTTSMYDLVAPTNLGHGTFPRRNSILEESPRSQYISRPADNSVGDQSSLPRVIPLGLPAMDRPQEYINRAYDSRPQNTLIPPALSRVKQLTQPGGLPSPSSSSNTASPPAEAYRQHEYNEILPSRSYSEELSYSPEKTSFDRPSKRLKREDSSTMPPPTAGPLSPYSTTQYATPMTQNSIGSPLTPAASSTHSDDGYRGYTPRYSPLVTHDTSEIRRMSVNSLLSGPPGMPHESSSYSGGMRSPAFPLGSPTGVVSEEETFTWGLDRGFKDLDIGKNDDMNATSGASPAAIRDLDCVVDEDGALSPDFGFGLSYQGREASYYATPVPISIPRSLEPLPQTLMSNPMNMLYFHHFLNATARALLPHECTSNPFKSLLPQMAVRDPDLMNLLLTYSASHRARLLHQPEPNVRIAHWMNDVFGNLRKALSEDKKRLTNESLATAIMLASLEIIAPNAFGQVSVKWQDHLTMARRIISERGGAKSMKSPVESFLLRWFLYLDVIGSLSGAKLPPSNANDDDEDYASEAQDNRIDCLLGFTPRLVHILARIADLARQCDADRIAPDHSIHPLWRPTAAIIAKANRLMAQLEAARTDPNISPCPMPHAHSSPAESAADDTEMSAVNEAFAWAGLIHLHRRILGKESTSADVQAAVRKVIELLARVRKGSAAEGCLLFVMFTTGCDARDEDDRDYIRGRMINVEALGMAQVHKARALMEKAWAEDRPWETLVTGEFFG